MLARLFLLRCKVTAALLYHAHSAQNGVIRVGPEDRIWEEYPSRLPYQLSLNVLWVEARRYEHWLSTRAPALVCLNTAANKEQRKAAIPTERRGLKALYPHYSSAAATQQTDI